MAQNPDILKDMLLWVVAVMTISFALFAAFLYLRRERDAPVRKRPGLLLGTALTIAVLLAAGYWLSGERLPSGSADAVFSGSGASAPREPEADSMLDRLGTYFDKQPSDARAWVLLARRQAEAERFAEAAQAYEKALALPSKVAKDPAVWCEYADALGMTQQGRLAGKPRQLVDQALALKPDHPKALEMAGSAEYEQGNYAAALDFWRPLLTQLNPGSAMHRELASAIARTELLAASPPVERRR